MKKRDASKVIQEQLEKLDSWGKGEVMLLAAFHSFDNIDLVKNAVALMLGWHQEQHPNFKRCEKCETIERLVVMCQMLEEIVKTSKKTK